MEHDFAVSRRAALGAVAAAGLAGLAGPASPAAAQQNPTPANPPPAGNSRLPARENFVIRNAYVMTMDAALGDVAGGDIHVDNGSIVAVGRNLQTPGAASLDGSRTIVLPGLVETHWHMWNTLMRGMAGDKPERGYYPTTSALGNAFQAHDMFQGTRLGAAEAINSGMTFVHDWCHNIPNLDFAYEDIRALQEVGIRARFSYGWWQGQKPEQEMHFADLESLHREWNSHSNEGLISLGFGWRGVASGPGSYAAGDIYRREIAAVRALGIPVSAHANSAGKGQVEHYAKENLLGKDLQILNPIQSTDDEIKSLAAAGCPVSFSPVVGMRIGRGFPQTGKFIAAGLKIGLSIDDTVLGGNADMFAIMKLVRNSENASAHSEFKMLPRRVLELATIEGARSMGIDSITGSLTPGKRADLIMISLDDVNLGMFTDPANMIVDAVQPSNVDTVVVDGRILKRGGKLTAIDKREVISDATAALTAIRQRANW
jgi:5-methylthioadenosine/S-adenosylhomocysteine deaminase